MSETKGAKMTKEQANNLLEFAQGLYGTLAGYGYYNPFTQHDNLVELNNDSLVPTYDAILKALKAVPYDYKKLAGYSEFMEVFDNIYGNVLKYMRGLMAFDLSISCTNIKDPTEYKSKEYQDDLRRVYKFLDNFDYKQEFRDKIVPEILRKETAYTFFRDSHEDLDTPIDLETSPKRKNEKFALQIMPQNYCMITGYFDSSQLLYDFDMNYFLKGTVDIDLFAPIFKKKYRELFDGDQKYVPHAQLNKRTGEYAQWVQLSPIDGAYAFKMDLSNFRQVPPFASLLKTCFNNQIIEDYQLDKDALTARAFLYGQMRLYDNAKSGTKPNQFAIDPKTLGQFMGMVASSVKGMIQPIAMPTENNDLKQIKDDSPDMAINQLKTSAGQAVSASSLIYTSDKMSQFELQNAIETDYEFMASLYPQFNNFMNFYVNRKTRKYKFAFEFDGCTKSFHREKRQKSLNELMTIGLVPNASYIASVYGIKPHTFDRMLTEAHYGDLVDKLTPLINIYNMKNGVADSASYVGKNEGSTVKSTTDARSEGGSQTKDTNDLTDSGAESRDYE